MERSSGATLLAATASRANVHGHAARVTPWCVVRADPCALPGFYRVAVAEEGREADSEAQDLEKGQELVDIGAESLSALAGAGVGLAFGPPGALQARLQHRPSAALYVGPEERFARVFCRPKRKRGLGRLSLLRSAESKSG